VVCASDASPQHGRRISASDVAAECSYQSRQPRFAKVELSDFCLSHVRKMDAALRFYLLERQPKLMSAVAQGSAKFDVVQILSVPL
jgi:hypothetical protein